MAPNFKTLLSKPLDEVERPKNLPGGSWYGHIKSWDMGESSEKKTPFIQYNILIVRPGPDIAEEELEGLDMTKLRTIKTPFYITDDALYRWKEFAQSCGVETVGRSVGEAMPDLKDAEVLCQVALEPSKNRDGSLKTDANGQPEYYNTITRISGTALLAGE